MQAERGRPAERRINFATAARPGHTVKLSRRDPATLMRAPANICLPVIRAAYAIVCAILSPAAASLVSVLHSVDSAVHRPPPDQPRSFLPPSIYR